VVAPPGQNHSKSTGKIHVHNGERYIKRLRPSRRKKSVPLITEKRLQANRELLIGQKIKRFFPGHGGALGTVKKYFFFKRHVLLDFCSLMVITSECLFLIYFVSFRQSHKVDDKRKYWKVVKVKALSRGKSLIDSR
jgi:hypothetical protein